jgi:ATP-dependent Zn protease
VRGFSQQYGSESANISSVFEKARESAPCLLILEDLDSLVNPKNRSFFLNELDGFTRNRGIFIIASANDPGKLDAALVNRPSRFDRKYLFDLPAVAERQRYLEFLSRSLADELQLDADEAARVADATEGFSFAYLKELVLSSMMAWISDGRRASFAGVMEANATFLLSQMAADPVPTPEVFSESDDDDEE